MEIKIGIKGEILKPKVKQKYIFIEDNTNEGGYYVYQSDRLDEVETGYDTWIKEDELEGYIKSNNWQIKWLDE